MVGGGEGQVTELGVYPFGALGRALGWRAPSCGRALAWQPWRTCCSISILSETNYWRVGRRMFAYQQQKRARESATGES